MVSFCPRLPVPTLNPLLLSPSHLLLPPLLANDPPCRARYPPDPEQHTSIRMVLFTHILGRLHLYPLAGRKRPMKQVSFLHREATIARVRMQVQNESQR